MVNKPTPLSQVQVLPHQSLTQPFSHVFFSEKGKTFSSSGERLEEVAYFGRYSKVHGTQKSYFQFKNTLDWLTDQKILKAEIGIKISHSYYHNKPANLVITPVTTTKIGSPVSFSTKPWVFQYVNITDSLSETEQPLTGLWVEGVTNSLRDYGYIKGHIVARVQIIE